MNYLRRIIELDKRREEILEEWKTEAPHKVGDIIAVEGYSYQGKQMKINRIDIVRGWRRYFWRIRGNVLKKDGTKSLRSVHFDITIKE